ncbi:MAG: hypothetical protein DRP51_03015 [Candidatus Zixiibacteriota bacterium]|nr:MAG: hypothetical protein DRP51_03015 [candidate division Zixibacteria bacterium]HHI02495.1 hypothetical protein [candidate division Zixibacteria bacterium]
MNRLLKFSAVITGIFLIISCAEKNPPRDEIPLIKNLLGRFEQAVRDKNRAGIDSLIVAEAYDLGYHSTKILSDIYRDLDTGSFLKFGGREFSYTRDKGVVSCFIVSDTADTGCPVEITVVKKYDKWYLKRFDLK